MTVELAAENNRICWAVHKQVDACKKVNVTSAQAKKSKYRVAFSPMQPIEGGYKGFDRFESYWQSGKVWEGIPHAVSVGWWKKQNTAKRRYPRGSGRRAHGRSSCC